MRPKKSLLSDFLLHSLLVLIVDNLRTNTELDKPEEMSDASCLSFAGFTKTAKDHPSLRMTFFFFLNKLHAPFFSTFKDFIASNLSTEKLIT